jgi:hypothetical protein
LNGKSFIFSTDIPKSSLHLCKLDVGRDLQTEAFQQNCLMLAGGRLTHRLRIETPVRVGSTTLTREIC